MSSFGFFEIVFILIIGLLVLTPKDMAQIYISFFKLTSSIKKLMLGIKGKIEYEIEKEEGSSKEE